MELNLHFEAHPTEEDLEAYALNRLHSERVASLETHLLVCEHCQDALAGVDELIADLKLVDRSLAQVTSPKPPAIEQAGPRTASDQPPKSRAAAGAMDVSWWGRIVGFAINPQWAVPGSLAAAALLVFLFWPSGQTAALPVTLSSFRGAGLPGAEAAGIAHAAARTPLDLSIASASVAVNGSFRVEIVNESGKVMWSGPLSDTGDGRFSAKVRDKLGVGAYWVRLYDPSSKLMQEYGLMLD